MTNIHSAPVIPGTSRGDGILMYSLGHLAYLDVTSLRQFVLGIDYPKVEAVMPALHLVTNTRIQRIS